MAATRIDHGRSFTQAQWQFIEQQLAQLPKTSSHQRLRFTLHLLYATGLRLAEAVAARVDHLNWASYPPDADEHEPIEGWELTVMGKGGKQRVVPVPLDVIGELANYLAARGLDPDPNRAPTVSLICWARRWMWLSARRGRPPLPWPSILHRGLRPARWRRS
jgi:site-specific recombinase XerD